MKNIALWVILLLIFSANYTWSNDNLKLSSSELVRTPEVTILYSIYTTQKDISGINKMTLTSIINNQIPLKIEKNISDILSQKDSIILGFEKRKDKFDAVFLKDFGRGLKTMDQKNLMESKNIIVVGITSINRKNYPSKAASILAYAVAKECNGTIFDVSTLECFSTSTFIKMRMRDELGKLRANVISRVCKPENNIYRLVTRGMKKYGLPDISIYNLKKDYLIMAHLLLLGIAEKLYEDSQKNILNIDKFTIKADDIKKIIKKGDKYPVTLKENGKLNYTFAEDKKGKFDDLNRIVTLKSLSSEINIIEEAKVNLFNYKEREIFDYIAADDISLVAKRARKFIPRLIKEFKAGRKGEEFYCMIVPNIPIESDNLIWVKLVGIQKDGNLIGSVIPKQKARTLSPGDNLIFSIYSIYDWLYIKDGVTIGGDYLKRYIEYKKNEKN